MAVVKTALPTYTKEPLYKINNTNQLDPPTSPYSIVSSKAYLHVEGNAQLAQMHTAEPLP